MRDPLPRVLNYHGGKFRLAPWLLRFAPPHRCFVDAYGGSAALLCWKPPVDFEVYNDAGAEVVNFFRVLRSRPQDLAQQIALTPWSRAEFALSWEPAPAADTLEAARRFFVRSWQGRSTGKRGAWRCGWRYQRQDTRGSRFTGQWAALPEALRHFAQRLVEVQIEHDAALRVIQRFDSPTTLTLCDPPYLPSVRSRWAGRAYEEEMDEPGHRQLADALQGLQGYALVCGYRSEVYAEIYEARGWRREETRARNTAGLPAVECVWISPRTQQALRQQAGPLFSFAASAAGGQS